MTTVTKSGLVETVGGKITQGRPLVSKHVELIYAATSAVQLF